MKYFIILALLFLSCTRNLTKGSESAICEIHNFEMKSDKVKIMYGLPNIKDEYFIDKKTLYPHCREYFGGCVRPILPKWYAKIWICKECNKAREDWINEKGNPRKFK